MVEAQISRYGSWKSPITSDLIVSGAIGLMQVAVDGADVYWVETRPQEKGRYVIVKLMPDGRKPDRRMDFTPAPFNARTRVHEYGGGGFTADRGRVYFSNFADQRIYYQTPGGEPAPLTPETGRRYADMVVDRDRHRLIAVREDHAGQEPVNEIVGVDLESGEDRVLVSGNDFYASPRLSPDGRRLVWLTWNHPNMPWDGTELMGCDLDDAGFPENGEQIAGGK